MTEKELKKLNRYQILELLIMQTERADALTRELEQMKQELDSRNVRIAELGSIAEASLQLNGVFDAAQKAADQYLEAARSQADTILREAEEKAQQILHNQEPISEAQPAEAM